MASDLGTDVVIVGGGLAGLTLALQLNLRSPGLPIVVLERNAFPATASAHKVGEATVERGAHYLAHTLGLESLLEETQLRKFGLRLFFGSGFHNDLSGADELGASKLLPAISYQLDRGVLENSLVELLRMRGIEIRDRCAVSAITAVQGGKPHTVFYNLDGQPHSLSCRWLVDASARSALLKKSLKLSGKCTHRMSAAWFRLDASIAVDDWSSDIDWQQRCNGSPRRASTNHLMGHGYWAWIIPLAGNRTSIGLVADPAVHELSTYSSIDRFIVWADRHQSQLATRISEHRRSLLDFRRLAKLSQSASKVWSADCWATTGESGVYADPFYSPGTDFIAMSNTFVT
jgi:2-polyprenyl-6-methoxyphenol hydroxylase-like FAD-dependent oxidoreductase